MLRHRKRKLGNKTKLEPKLLFENHESGGREDSLRVQPLDAPGVSYQAYYSEVGKASHRGKDRTEARSPQRKLMPDTVGPGQHEPTSLRGIATGS